RLSRTRVGSHRQRPVRSSAGALRPSRVAGTRSVEGDPTNAVTRNARTGTWCCRVLHQWQTADLREATERNLKDQGYEWTSVIVQPAGVTLASALDLKA